MSKNYVETNIDSIRLGGFFSNPWVGIIGSIASIIGLILAIYFYQEAKESPQLAYYVNPAKAIMVKAGQTSKLKVNFMNKVIDTDITAAQIAFWNEGKKAVKKENILKPISIYTENGVPILEATIRKSSREITQLTLNPVDQDKGRITLSWNILENNDGAIIQLIYAGSPEVTIKAEGVVEGQKQIDQLKPSLSRQIDSKFGFTDMPNWIYKTGHYLFILSALLFFARLIQVIFTKRKATDRSGNMFKIIGYIVFIAFLIIMAFTSRDFSPPLCF